MPAFGGGRFSEWRLEGDVAGARRSWSVFQCLIKIPKSSTGEEFELTSTPLDSSSASSASIPARGLLVRLMLGEGLRGATRSLTTFFGYVLQLAR